MSSDAKGRAPLTLEELTSKYNKTKRCIFDGARRINALEIQLGAQKQHIKFLMDFVCNPGVESPQSFRYRENWRRFVTQKEAIWREPAVAGKAADLECASASDANAPGDTEATMYYPDPSATQPTELDPEFPVSQHGTFDEETSVVEVDAGPASVASSENDLVLEVDDDDEQDVARPSANTVAQRMVRSSVTPSPKRNALAIDVGVQAQTSEKRPRLLDGFLQCRLKSEPAEDTLRPWTMAAHETPVRDDYEDETQSTQSASQQSLTYTEEYAHMTQLVETASLMPVTLSGPDGDADACADSQQPTW